MTPDFLGDLLVAFSTEGEPPPGRTAARWEITRSDAWWRLWRQPPAPGWKGTPCVSSVHEPWHLWLLGELYGPPSEISRAVNDFGEERRGIESFSGHFLLLAWNTESRQWHVWTDRFGTLHAYYGSDGRRAAIGTFFPAVASMASRRKLDWLGLAGFFSFGFFPQDRTYFEDVRILRPATHSVFHEKGRQLRSERYWHWRHEPDRRRGYDETLEEFEGLMRQVMADHTREGRIAIPISGGLDSRSTVAALSREGGVLPEKGRLWSYSYGYSAGSPETQIAKRVAAARGLPFEAFTIGPYLDGRLDWVLASVEGFLDVTLCRQAAVADEIARRAEFVIAAHWGDVWLNDMGLPAGNSSAPGEEEVYSHALSRLEKPGRAWLLEEVCAPRLAGDPEVLLRDLLRGEIARVNRIEDPDFRVKAFKTDLWSFRWTTASLRMFQPGAFPRLPFYDTRLTDFFATVPSEFVRARRLQIDYLKRFAPDLARIAWQRYDANLFHYPYFNSWLLPKRAFRKARRLLAGRPPIERNWEVQFRGAEGQRVFERWLLRPGLRLHEFVPAGRVRGLIEDLPRASARPGRGYTVSMLLTFSAMLERYG